MARIGIQAWGLGHRNELLAKFRWDTTGHNNFLRAIVYKEDSFLSKLKNKQNTQHQHIISLTQQIQPSTSFAIHNLQTKLHCNHGIHCLPPRRLLVWKWTCDACFSWISWHWYMLFQRWRIPQW